MQKYKLILTLSASTFDKSRFTIVQVSQLNLNKGILERAATIPRTLSSKINIETPRLSHSRKMRFKKQKSEEYVPDGKILNGKSHNSLKSPSIEIEMHDARLFSKSR